MSYSIHTMQLPSLPNLFEERRRQLKDLAASLRVQDVKEDARFEADLFKDPAMLQQLSELDMMDSESKSHILHVLDGFIKSVKFKNIAAL